VADDKATWSRPTPTPELSSERALPFIARAFPRRRVVVARPLRGGLSNFNYALRLDDGQSLVLRIYDRHPDAWRKEADLHGLLRPSVPVPEVLWAEPEGIDGRKPFLLMQHVDGITLRELKQSGDERALREAAGSVGEALARIAQHEFPRPGRLLAGPSVGPPFLAGADPAPRFVDQCLASSTLQARTGVELARRIHDFIWAWAPRLTALDGERRLVHGDFNSPNLMVRLVDGRWRVVAVLDWEFALSGSPLFDVGNFLRYERAARPLREPAFSSGFRAAGGVLPDDWRRLARVVDLTSLCEILTRDPLPGDVVSDVVELLRAALADRDPA
jgi:aminoglycoside phosphotransferase (APT) family kinase protein